MSGNDELNIAVAEALGWKHIKGEEPVYGGPFKHAGWESPAGHFHLSAWRCKSSLGLPRFSKDLSTAMRLLDGHGWVLHTCDNGYLCQIHEAPEKGEAVLGNGVGATPAEAICRAFLEMKKG